ncbi:MAG TPA: methyltransferase domain-containing protein [Sphingomicrobium sp.]|nr:methyltransferase domain-containing protein [Sphingomicrobium sp.]
MIDLLCCPTCKRAPLKPTGGGLECDQCRSMVAVHGRRYDFEPETISTEWQAQQDAALPEYHEEEYNADTSIPRLFGNFMAVSLDRNGTVLDIGSGISPQLPHYVAELGLQNYIGVEPFRVEVNPEYTMLAGAIAERLPLQDETIGAVIFATSMDHIEGLEQAMAEVRRVLKPNGAVYAWIGVYDPGTIATAKTFDVIWRGGPLRKAARLIGAPVEQLHTLWKMRDRRKRLATGPRLTRIIAAGGRVIKCHRSSRNLDLR